MHSARFFLAASLTLAAEKRTWHLIALIHQFDCVASCKQAIIDSSRDHQGDVFRVNLKEPTGSEPGYRHPHVIIQNNLFNRSRINTVVVCALTSNLKRSKAPGNVLLSKGGANLPKKSVINISQIFTIDKGLLSERIGSLSEERFLQVLEGIKILTEPTDILPQRTE